MAVLNNNVRRKAKDNGIPLWKICNKLGISEPTITRWLREPLPKEKEAAILKAINEIIVEREGEEND